MIRLLALDIDGVLTDGRLYLTESGSEMKTLFFRDIDAVYLARREGIDVALITGEDTIMVDVVSEKLGVSVVFRGRKDKEAALRELCADANIFLEEVAYAGDSDRDAAALAVAGRAYAPCDASDRAKAVSIVVTKPGGAGAVEEMVADLLRARDKV